TAVGGYVMKGARTRTPSQKKVEMTCSGEQLTAAIRGALHRSAVLELLAEEVVEMFIVTGEGGPPRFVIAGSGVQEVADADVVLDVATQLRALARSAADSADR